MGMKAPKLPAAPQSGPRMIDPLVMYARMRDKQKAGMMQGRQSTIMAGPAAKPQAMSVMLGGGSKSRY